MPGVPPTLQQLTVKVRKWDTTAVEGCGVKVRDADGVLKHTTTTPGSGDVYLSFYMPPAFELWTVELRASGFVPLRLGLSRIANVSYVLHATMDAILP